ncbi:MAG: hypothetical protein ACE5GK_07730 [Nitrospiria bacterium]
MPQLEIGGELELEWIDSQSNGRSKKAPDIDTKKGQLEESNNSVPRFSIDKIVVSPKVSFDAGIVLKADLELNPDKAVKVDEAWILIPDLPLDTWIKIGLEDVFIKPSRKTESYPIVGHAYWQDEDLGLFMGGERDRFYWRLSLSNSRRLKDRQASEDATFPIPTYDDDNVEKNTNKQIGFGLGFDHAFKEGHWVDILPFYYHSELSDADRAYLETISTYPGGSNDDQRLYGVNLDYRLRAFSFFGQYIRSEDGEMDRWGGYIQPSFKQKLGMKRLKSLEFLLRWEVYEVDLLRDASDARTWDRQTTTLAVISEIVHGFKIKTEYYINDEETGGPEFDNNELLFQYEMKF